jgi:hypothetical protein
MNDITMTKDEWLAEGKKRFGPDMKKWKFVCPGCGHIQAVEDFAQYKDSGATPESATRECIGRYSGGKSWFETPKKKLKDGPCDYAGYGLFRISPVTVVDGEKKIMSFAFAEVT